MSYVEAARGLVRPVVTVLLVVATVAMEALGRDVSEWLVGLTGATVAWWFGERGAKRAVERAQGER